MVHYFLEDGGMRYGTGSSRLSVREIIDEDGKETGMFEAPAAVGDIRARE
jgi:hypothetical protein